MGRDMFDWPCEGPSRCCCQPRVGSGDETLSRRVRAAAGLWLLLTEFTCGELLQFILDGRSGVVLGVSLVGWCIPFGG